MPDTLNNITANCGNANPKGFKQAVYISELAKVASIPAADANTLNVSTAITMTATNVFFKWEISENEQKWETNPEGDTDSMSYVTEVEFFIAGITAAKSYILGTNGTGCPLCIIMEDKNGNLRILGEADNGVRIQAKEQLTPKAGYLVTARVETALPPLFYGAAIPT